MTTLLDLNKKTLQPARIAELALDDKDLLQALLQGISPAAKKASLRENCSQALLYLAENWPEVLLSHWPYFVDLLKSDNGFSKYVAIYVITSLVPIDKKGCFEKDFDVYYGLLDDESVMVASHAAGNSGKIAAAKPALQSKITKRLLGLGQTHFDARRQALIAAYAIEALSGYYAESKDQARIITFVRQQVNSPSPKTRKLAKAFLQKWVGE